MRNATFTFFLIGLSFNRISLTLGKSALASLVSSETISEGDAGHNYNYTVDQNFGLSLMGKPKNGIKVINNTNKDARFVSQLGQLPHKQLQKLPRRIARRILQDASKRSDLPSRKLFNFGEVFTEEFNPIDGWEVTVRLRERSVNYHVNRIGTQIVLDPNAKL